MKVPISRYTSSSWMREEKEKLWDNVWLLVTHQSMFPEEGSTQRFTIMGKEIVVVRHANGFSAFRNRCPHRGTPLVSKSGSFSHFRCPYHHWTFALDGRILSMPQCEKDDSLSLEELPCEQALGFIWL
ncbi:MAG: Rieske (2Fe-2S) protein, partial [Myxococcota bacterium]|nr:Rieske (2Fe-2S) protein [Myxococcota bacterium]